MDVIKKVALRARRGEFRQFEKGRDMRGEVKRPRLAAEG